MARRQSAASDDLDMYMYAVSHDLRTSVFVIDAFGKLLMDEYGQTMDNTAREFVDNIRKSTQSMALLIEDLLSIAGITELGCRSTVFDLSKLVRSITEGLRAENPERLVEVGIQADVMLDADSELMKIVMQELLGNAWKAVSRTPSPQIRVTCDRQADRQIISVLDNGLGFDMQHRDRLFMPFKKLHASSEFDGRGVGLTKVRRAIELMGGDVWAESGPGKGAAFHVALRLPQ